MVTPICFCPACSMTGPQPIDSVPDYMMGAADGSNPFTTDSLRPDEDGFYEIYITATGNKGPCRPIPPRNSKAASSRVSLESVLHSLLTLG
jgi:hypothetical protein